MIPSYRSDPVFKIEHSAKVNELKISAKKLANYDSYFLIKSKVASMGTSV